MATRVGNKTVEKNRCDVVWLALANGDVGGGVEIGRYNKVSFQAKGTFGAGGTCTMQGSNDGATWGALGAGLTATDSKVQDVPARPKYIRPNITAGDGTTALEVYLTASE
jgi:hypothetical protein